MTDNPRRRIAILADFPWGALEGDASGRGGGQGCTWLPQLAQGFAAHPEFEIHWVVLDRRKAGATTVERFGQHFHRLPATSVSLDLALGNLPARWNLKKFLRRLQPDIVHAWGTELIYPAALRDFRGPTILSMQGVLTEYQRIGGLPDDWRWRRMVSAEPAMIRSATVVTCESEWGIARIKEVDPSAECRLVEYGVHPRFYDVPWQPAADKPYALYVGGAGTRKGFDLLIEAMKLLPDRAWELRLAGDDGMAGAVEAAGLTKVRSLGLLPEGLGERAYELAQCGLHARWRCRGRSGYQKQGTDLARRQPGEVGASAAQEPPPAPSALHGVHGQPGNGQRFEVAAGCVVVEDDRAQGWPVQ